MIIVTRVPEQIANERLCPELQELLSAELAAGNTIVEYRTGLYAADAVLAQGLQCSTSVGHLSMEEEAYRRHGVAAEIYLTGDIEGRIILDLAPETAVRVASHYAGAEVPESDDLVRETVCELANQITGNAVTALNDQGFHFRVHPPVLHTSEHGAKSSEDTEALVMSFETERGNMFMNIALRYNRRRQSERAAVVGQ